MDCHALLAVLAAPLPVSGETGLAHLIKASRLDSHRVHATGSPFDSKDTLRGRGYRWDAERKVWHTQVPSTDALDAECAWLKQNVYKGRSVSIEVARLSALDRHSGRPGVSSMIAL